MDDIPEEHILAMGTSLFKILGEFTAYRWKTPIRIYRFFNCFVCILNMVLLLANLSQAEGYMYIKILQSFATITHCLIKYVCLFCYNAEILELIRETTQFYDVTEVKEIFSFSKTLLSLCRKFQKVFVVIGIVSIHMHFILPVTTGVGLIFPSMIVVDSIIFETIILFSQYYFLLLIAVVVPAYDIIYVSYSVLIIIQLRILKYKFENTSRNMSTKEIYGYIKYHQLLLSIFNRMYGVYLWMFFFMYFLTLISACVQLYTLLLGGDKIVDVIEAFLYVASLILQLSFYTFPIEEIVLQFSEISAAIYKSSWYERSLEDRKLLLFVMMRAQRQNYLSAGGIIDMNVDTFTSVIRKVCSFYAILRNVLNN